MSKCKLLSIIKCRQEKTKSKNNTNITECVKSFIRCDQTEDEFVLTINQWLEKQKNIKKAECQFEFHDGFTVIGQRSFLDSVDVRYKLSKDGVGKQYSVLLFEHFGVENENELMRRLKSENAEFSVVESACSVHSKDDTLEQLVQIYLFCELGINEVIISERNKKQ